MQNAMRTIGEAGAGAGTAVIASGALSPVECDTPTFSEYPLFFVDQFAFTIDDGFRSLAAFATVVTIIYFLNKFRS